MAARKKLKGFSGVVLGDHGDLGVAVVESRELRNEKKYTVRELLGSEEAMKDLLHERLLAVRDDLNFAINACNPSAAVNLMTREIRAMTAAVNSQADHLRALSTRSSAHEDVIHQVKLQTMYTFDAVTRLEGMVLEMATKMPFWKRQVQRFRLWWRRG